jgi:methylated-DNA-protein-cysteine methyltransferase-like protein
VFTARSYSVESARLQHGVNRESSQRRRAGCPGRAGGGDFGQTIGAMKPARPSPIFGRVRALVKAIPRGRVATYGQLSSLIEKRLTPVGIGWALSGCGDEIPWHRVINSRGTISTRGPAADLQRSLLEAEGVRFRGDGSVDLAACQWKRGSRLPLGGG